MKTDLRILMSLLPALILAFSPVVLAGINEDTFAALDSGNVQKVRRLLASGADVNARDERGDTLLMLAVVSGSAEITELLVARGADVNARDKLSVSPLHLAAIAGDRDIVKLLIAHGADVNAKDTGYPGERTPLVYAFLPRLLAMRVKPQLSPLQQWTMQRFIRNSKGQWREVAKLLIDHGANIDTGSRDVSLLYMAANAGDKVWLSC